MSFSPPDVEQLRIISDAEAIRNILGERGRYAMYLGAGASAEAGVLTTEAICRQIRSELLTTAGLEGAPADEVDRWADEFLNWSDTSRRYVTCIRRSRANEARRVEYFRELLIGVSPSFCHYAVALLMTDGYLSKTCLTTNFDHLLERAFMEEGIAECQPIRSDFESGYWNGGSDRYYLVKLHGDIDTLNILNTRQETMAISAPMSTIVESLLRGSGLVVLGTGANEVSVQDLFKQLAQKASGADGVLSFGLLWGVYMGLPKPHAITPNELRQRVLARIQETEINRAIVEAIGDSRNALFCFFPVWSAGQFLRDLITATKDKPLIGRATQHLDRELRLRQVFTAAGLSDEAVTRHLQALRKQRSITGDVKLASPEPELVLTATSKTGSPELRIMYGDITSRSLMGADEFATRRRAVVSPEDTLVTAGGGVAHELLEKAGPQAMLNEIAKFAPIPQRSVAVTSAGALPAHYVFHAATIEVDQAGTYAVSKDDVTETVVAVLDAASALDVQVVWIPLLAAGVASLKPVDSFEGLLDAVRRWSGGRAGRPLTIVTMIYQERIVSREQIARSVAQVLADDFEVQPAPPAAVEAAV